MVSKIQSESINLADNFAFTGTVSGAGGVNTPAFFASVSADQTVSDNTVTKVQCDTEHYDTNSAYDNSSNFRFQIPNGQAGKYHVYASIQTRSVNNTEQYQTTAFIYKNGSNYLANENNPYNNPVSVLNTKLSAVIDLAVGDYLELYGRTDVQSGTAYFRHDSAAHTDNPTIGTTHFGAYKIIT
tara:strand:- start:13 stop:564 length:552 start_codon:yes stop_codon:yes gene_type:complete